MTLLRIEFDGLLKELDSQRRCQSASTHFGKTIVAYFFYERNHQKKWVETPNF